MHPHQEELFIGLVSRPKLNGFGKHLGFLLLNGQVAHMETSGAVVVSFEDFALGRPVQLEKAANPQHYRQIQYRAYQSIGRTPQYDLFKGNCEHYAYWLLDGKPQSPQVAGLFVVAGIAVWLKLAAA